ncbi:hypothetical protein [Nonlabens xiamenensis]|uniref:hypothetical protein n=1 Tax=Nonlabens xiamenensis TaxID=2341043 RepID=UPI000F60815B|nr:hypothetical protein [Nonlabens xiamenensis]
MKLDKRNIILIMIILVIIVISWQFTVKNTFAYHQELKTINIQGLKEKQRNLERLASQNRMIKTKLAENNISQKDLRTLLLQYTKEAQSLEIVNYNDEIVISGDLSIVKYHQLQLKGQYRELIQFIDQLLQDSSNTRLVSASWLVHKRTYRESEHLSLELILLSNR